MPHKTAALMRFSSGSQAAAKRNPHSISAEWLVVPGFWFLAPGPGFWSLVPGSLAALSASNHRHIILLSSGSQTAQLAQEPFSRLSRFSSLFRLGSHFAVGHMLPVIGHQEVSNNFVKMLQAAKLFIPILRFYRDSIAKSVKVKGC